MSRIGKQPIVLPAKVTVTMHEGTVTVKGPLGTLVRKLHPKVTATQEGQQIIVSRRDNGQDSRALHGLSRALLQNMVTGVSQGFTRELELVGVGYRAQAKGKVLELSLGHSHPIVCPIDAHLKAQVNGSRIILSGCDLELLGETAAKIRRFRPPDVYKGKGVRYVNEVVRKKAGKTAGTGATAAK